MAVESKMFIRLATFKKQLNSSHVTLLVLCLHGPVEGFQTFHSDDFTTLQI